MDALQNVAGITVLCHCSTKATKYPAIQIFTCSKLNSVHSHISKAVEVEKYHAMKEEICHKNVPAVGSMIDEKTKNKLIKWGHDQAHASFIKKFTVGSESSSP